MNNINPNGITGAIFFVRFLAFVFIFLFPVIIFFIQTVIFFIWKDRKYLSNRISDEFHKYNNIIHNLMFGASIIFIMIIVVSMTLFSILTYNNDVWWKQNEYIWKFNYYVSKNFFYGWFYFGLSLHLYNNLFYLFYNIQRTECYFAIKYQAWIKKRKLSKK